MPNSATKTNTSINIDERIFESNVYKDDIYTAVLGKGMLINNPLLPQLLGHPLRRWYPWYRLTRNKADLPQQVAGWGQKKSYFRAQRLGRKLRRPVLSIEDGFLRSINTGIQSRYACSVVIDNLGIYFNSYETSTLEQFILLRQQQWTSKQQQRSQQLISQILSQRLSKYNAKVDAPCLSQLASTLTHHTHSTHILIVDQVRGDASINGAGATAKNFKQMIHKACQAHPEAMVWIKAHPASKQGCINQPRLLNRLRKRYGNRIAVLTEPMNAIALLKQVQHVYTVSSHMGFEALLLAKKVHCFGVTWYSGWGLTDDDGAPKRLMRQVRRRRQKIAQQLQIDKRLDQSQHSNNEFNESRSNVINVLLLKLFHSAYIDYSYYADPASKQSCEIEQVINWLTTNRDWYLKLPSRMVIFEFSRWKIKFVKQFLQPIHNYAHSNIMVKAKPKFPKLTALFNRYGKEVAECINSSDILVWGLSSRLKVENIAFDYPKYSNNESSKIWCMEDGFIRSNGLGATLLAPLSVVMDSKGIYYDANHASDLEDMLRECEPLANDSIRRVEALETTLKQQRVSKYHVGSSGQLYIPATNDDNKLERILIVEQVEDDLSVKNCASDIQTNRQLIEQVAKDNPTAYLIYKPHPDVEAGLRKGRVDSETLKLVDKIARDTAMPDCLDAIDSVHTISSLTGFEALLRGKKVVCYGLPFYAGWGLTEDINPKNSDRQSILTRRHLSPQRKNNPLTLTQLIYFTLIKYPMYRLPEGHGLAQVEQVIDYLYEPLHITPINSNADDNVNPKPSTQKDNNPIKTMPLDWHLLSRKFVTAFMRLRNNFKD